MARSRATGRAGSRLGDRPMADHGGEIRCYMRDPDGHLIEVGQVVTRLGH